MLMKQFRSSAIYQANAATEMTGNARMDDRIVIQCSLHHLVFAPVLRCCSNAQWHGFSGIIRDYLPLLPIPTGQTQNFLFTTKDGQYGVFANLIDIRASPFFSPFLERLFRLILSKDLR